MVAFMKAKNYQKLLGIEALDQKSLMRGKPNRPNFGPYAVYILTFGGRIGAFEAIWPLNCKI